MPPAFDMPPKVWVPEAPAVIRPAEPELIRQGDPRFQETRALARGQKRHRGTRRPRPTRVYTDQVVDTGTASSYNFASRSIGTAASNRRVLVGVAGRKGGTSPTVTAVTVGGVSATELVQAENESANVVAFFMAAVPTGTTATIAVTLDAQSDRLGVSVWAIYDLASDTPTDTATDVSDDEPMDVSLNVAAGGMAFGVGFGANWPSNTWAGLTEDFETVLEGDLYWSGASAQGLSAASPRTITLGLSPYSTLRIAAAVSLR